MKTHNEIRAANKQSERQARAAARTSSCRCCGKPLLELIDCVESPVEVVDGSSRLQLWTPTGFFGYRRTGICSLRCGFRWANAHAEKAR